MNINISAVSGRREARFSFSFNERIEEVDCRDGAVFVTPVSLEGEVIKDGDIYYIDGAGSVDMDIQCER